MEINSDLYFSVIVCCYNPDLEKLKKTIISILKQKDVSFEIIISDDGSKFKYYNDIKTWYDGLNKDIKIKYNFLEANVGTVKNIISALELSESKYIKVISPGDYLFDENALKTYLDEFELHHYDMLFGDAIYYNQNKILSKKYYSYNRKIFKDKNIKKYYCLYGGYFLGATIAMKKDLLIMMLKRIQDKVLYIEDNPLVTMLSIENYAIHGIEKPLVWYECGTGISAKASTNTLFKDDFQRVHDFLKSYYPDNKIVKRIIKFYEFSKKSFFYKLVLYPFKFPKVILFKISKMIFGPKKYDVSITQLYSITKEDV